MYSHRFEPSHSRQYSDRSSRQGDGYNDCWERREAHRDTERDSHHKYGGCNEMKSRSREYCDSLKRWSNKDILNRERSRRSPVRRRMSSPDWGASEKKRQKFTEDDDDYRYKRNTNSKASRQSPDNSRAHATKDFKHRQPQEDDFKYRNTTHESRHRHRHEEVPYRHWEDDSTCRQSSGHYKDRDGHDRGWDCSPERTRTQNHSLKVSHKLHCVSVISFSSTFLFLVSLKNTFLVKQSSLKTRERNDSPVRDDEGHRYVS